MNRKELSRAAAKLGRKGGKAGTGKNKARTPAQARAAAKQRWRRYRERTNT